MNKWNRKLVLIQRLKKIHGKIHANQEYGEYSPNYSTSAISNDSKNSILNRWHEEMGSFRHSEIFSLEILAKEKRMIYININSIPATFKGAIVISSKIHHAFSLSVYSTKDNLLYKIENRNEWFFKILATEKGLFKVELENKNVKLNSTILK